MAADRPTRPPGRRERRQSEIRQRLLAAGRAIYSQYGIKDATIAQITEAADVGFGTFYLYFPTKEALYRAVVHSGFAGLGAQLDALLQEADSRQDPWRMTIAAGVDIFFRFAAEHRDLFSLMFAGQEQGGPGMGGDARIRLVDWATAVVRAAAEAECSVEQPADEDLIDILTFAVVGTLRRTAARWMRAHVDERGESSTLPAAVISRQVGAFIAAGLAAAICMDQPDPGPWMPEMEGDSETGA